MTEDMVFTLYAYEIANSDAISTFDLVAAGVAGGVVMKLFPGGLPNKVIAGLTTAAAFVGYSYASRLIQDTDNNVFFHFINKDGKYPAIITVDMDGDVFINLHEFKNGDNFSNDFDYGAGNQTIKESHSKNQLSTNSDYADDNFFKLIVDRTVMPQLNGKCDRHLLYATRDTANTYLNVGSKPKRGRGDPKMIDCLYQKGDGSGSDGAGPDKNGDGWIAHWKLKNLTNYCSVAWVINDMKNTGIGIGLLKMTACIVHSLVSYIFQPDGFPDVLKRLIDSKLIARAPPFEFVFNRQRLLNI